MLRRRPAEPIHSSQTRVSDYDPLSRVRGLGRQLEAVEEPRVVMWHNGLSSDEVRTHMTRKRYKQQETGPFFGQYLYDRTVPDRHFLRQLEDLVNWSMLGAKLVRLYRGRQR